MSVISGDSDVIVFASAGLYIAQADRTVTESRGCDPLAQLISVEMPTAMRSGEALALHRRCRGALAGLPASAHGPFLTVR